MFSHVENQIKSKPGVSPDVIIQSRLGGLVDAAFWDHAREIASLEIYTILNLSGLGENVLIFASKA